MALINGKQIRNSSISLDKLKSNGMVNFTGVTVSFGTSSSLTTLDSNIISGYDVVNKNYVDAVASGLDPKIPVKLVSATGPCTLFDGIGTLTIDGVTVSAFDRILVAAQDGPNVATTSNGVYVATSSSWYRAYDSDGSPDNEVSHGNFVFVTDGNTYQHSGWVLSITDAYDPDKILVGTDSQGWVQFSEQTNIVAGNGLSYTGQVLNVGAGLGISVSNDTISVDSTSLSLATGSGVFNYIPRWNSQYNLSSTSSIYESDSKIGIGLTNSLATLHVKGGTSSPVFKVDGTSGELFSITDSLTGKLFSVNDISGLPILEVNSDNTVYIGEFPNAALFTTKQSNITPGVNSIYAFATSSFSGAFIDYTVKSDNNARSGSINSVWVGPDISFTETSTIDIGTTSGITFSFVISGSYAVFQSFASSNWELKSIIRAI